MNKKLISLFLFISCHAIADNGSAPLLLSGDLETNNFIKKEPLSSVGEVKNNDVQDNQVRDKLKSFGSIVYEGPTNVPGVKAWVVNSGSGGKNKTLYTVNGLSNPVVFTGNAFDLFSGNTIHIQGGEQSSLSSFDRIKTAANYAFKGDYNGVIPPGIQMLESMPGYVEGEGEPSKTLYIFFDPLCPFCHKAFSETRQYVKPGSGYRIKWLPVDVAFGEKSQALSVVLLFAGNKDDAVQVNDLLHIKLDAKNAFENMMQANTPVRKSQLVDVANKMAGDMANTINIRKYKDLISDNNRFLFAQFDAHPEIEKRGVPAAFILDHRTGKAKMVMGVSEDAVLKDIFGGN